VNNSFATVMQVFSANNYAIMLSRGNRTEATYYGSDGATLSVGDRVFCEWAAGSNLWTISSMAT